MSGFKGNFGGFNMQQLMKQAQKMQEQMENAKKELQESEFEAQSGGGMVKVVMTGDKKLKSINLKPEIVDPEDIEMLQDLIIAAINDAVAQIEKVENDKNPGLPGLM